MFLIASGAYCTAELQSEFGALPPAFLPLGNKRLFQHQIARIPKGKSVYMTLPESFNLDKHDLNWLVSNKVNILFLPEELSLGESIVAALNLIDYRTEESLSLLYGDTLLLSYPEQKNCIAVSHVEDNYQWAYINSGDEPWLQEGSNLQSENTHSVVNGYFHFENPSALIKSLIAKRWKFLEGVNDYHAKHPMKPLHVEDWLDYGHIHTYFHSKAAFTTQRSFNELTISADCVKKSSINNKKIQAEALWFQNVPPKLRKFLPQLLGVELSNENVSYELEYLHHTALNELFVFGRLPVMTWKRILAGCFDFLDTCQRYSNTEDNSDTLDRLFKDKTKERLASFCESFSIDSSAVWHVNGGAKHSIDSLLALANKHLPKAPGAISVIHGDFCFSNILFDFRTSNVKTIDPRGLTSNGEFSVYGDIRYDIAKLSHSIIGEYDWIIAGYYTLTRKDYSIDFELSSSDTLHEIQAMFVEKIEQKYGVSYIELLAMQLHLFLSMLPLHSDDEARQFALFANAFRIANLLEESQS